eukprot:2516980-Rhodomonas_salina.1
MSRGVAGGSGSVWTGECLRHLALVFIAVEDPGGGEYDGGIAALDRTASNQVRNDNPGQSLSLDNKDGLNQAVDEEEDCDSLHCP